jgi:hypothetical protein
MSDQRPEQAEGTDSAHVERFDDDGNPIKEDEQ